MVWRFLQYIPVELCPLASGNKDLLVCPGIGVIPCVHAGGTDARFYGDICDNCVRFAPIIVKPDQLKGQHGINENIEAAVLPYAVDYFKEIIRLQEQRKN